MSVKMSKSARLRQGRREKRKVERKEGREKGWKAVRRDKRKEERKDGRQ